MPERTSSSTGTWKWLASILAGIVISSAAWGTAVIIKEPVSKAEVETLKTQVQSNTIAINVMTERLNSLVEGQREMKQLLRSYMEKP